MSLRTLRRLALVAVLAPIGLAFGQGPELVHIGVVPSLMTDLSDGQQKFIREEFPLMVKDVTGLAGKLEKADSTKDLADKILAGTFQFGVFQGLEFAEAQAKQPDLQPLLLSIYRSPQVKAVLLAKKDAPFKSFADLRGKDVAVLKEGKDHIRRFTEKESGGDPAKFFGKVIPSNNSETALDSILLDKVQAAIVDGAALETYREINPGRFRRLKVVSESPPFPPSVIAYCPKKADAAVLKQFKEGMLTAKDSAKGREVMSTFKITAFEPVPPGFEKSLEAIRKAFPE